MRRLCSEHSCIQSGFEMEKDLHSFFCAALIQGDTVNYSLYTPVIRESESHREISL